MSETTSKVPHVPGEGLVEELRLKIERLEHDAEKRGMTMLMQNTLLASQSETLLTLGWQLSLSQSFSKLMVKAHTALVSYRVDYRKLPSYKNWEGIDFFEGSDTLRYQEAMTRFIHEINHDLDAAIRRKTNIKEVKLD